MEWCQEFCLNCEQTLSTTEHGAYCSQACRLTDLERASCSSSSSPTSSASWSTTPAPTNSFYLPPSVNFSSYSLRPSHSHSTSSSPPTTRSPISYGASPSSQLYSSPSRTSLSSMNSYNQHSDSGLSDKIRNELHEYAGSFDQLRDAKRRMTVM